ncbi:nitroreductase family protein [Streptomyces puniciscabiei]
MILDVHEAGTSRRAAGGFTNRQVPREVLERVLSAAAWARSGSHLQPWRVQAGGIGVLSRRTPAVQCWGCGWWSSSGAVSCVAWRRQASADAPLRPTRYHSVTYHAV